MFQRFLYVENMLYRNMSIVTNIAEVFIHLTFVFLELKIESNNLGRF